MINYFRKEVRKKRKLNSLERRIQKTINVRREPESTKRFWSYNKYSLQKTLERMEKKHQSPSLKDYSIQNLEKQKKFLKELKKTRKSTPREVIFSGEEFSSKSVGYIKKYLETYFKNVYSNQEGFYSVFEEVKNILLIGNRRGDGVRASTAKELSGWKNENCSIFGYHSEKITNIRRKNLKKLETRLKNHDEFDTNFEAFIEKAKKSHLIDVYFTCVLSMYINKLEMIRNSSNWNWDILKTEGILKKDEEIEKFFEGKYLEQIGYLHSSISYFYLDNPYISQEKLAYSIQYLKTNERQHQNNYYFNDESNSKRTIQGIGTKFDLQKIKKLIID